MGTKMSDLNRIEELERICAESYIVLGTIANEADRLHDYSVIKALTNLSHAVLIHEDVLPFPSKVTKNV